MSDQPNKGEMLTLVVNGREVRMTQEQVLAEAQKSLGVLPNLQSERDRLDRELKETKAQSEGAFAFIEDFRTAMGDDPQASRAAMYRIGQAFGHSEDEVDDAISPVRRASPTEDGEREERPRKRRHGEEDDENEGEEDSRLRRRLRDEDEEGADTYRSREGGNFGRAPTINVGMKHLDPEVRREIEYLRSQRLRSLSDMMYQQVDQALAADPDIGQIIKGSPRAAQALKKVGREALRTRVVVEEREFGPQVLSEVVANVKALVQDTDIRAPQQSGPPERAKALGLGPAVEIFGDKLYDAEKPPERATLVDEGYSKNFMGRVAHRLLHLKKEAAAGEEAAGE
jgi:hypothetical protein